MSAARTVTRTGIEIGILHTPPQRPYHDADALRLQSALIDGLGQIDWDGIVIAGVCAVLLLALALWRWLA